MKLILDRNTILRSFFKGKRTEPTTSFSAPIHRKDVQSRSVAAAAQAYETDLSLSQEAQRKLFTGNYSAGAVAMINPRLWDV